VEKAYLFGRLTFEGQAKAFKQCQEKGKLSLRDLRELHKTDAYDPSTKWKEKCEGRPMNSIQKEFDSSKEPDPLSEDLACKLKEVISQLLSIMPKWKDDARIINLLDYKQLATLQNTVCAPRRKRCCNWCVTAGALRAGTGSATPSSMRMPTVNAVMAPARWPRWEQQPSQPAAMAGFRSIRAGIQVVIYDITACWRWFGAGHYRPFSGTLNQPCYMTQIARPT
jgi:hypothetical protein